MSSLLYKSLFNLKQTLPSTAHTEHNRNLSLSQLLHQTLDRVNVLGNDDGSYGHTGWAVSYRSDYYKLTGCLDV